jgi:23S rRNA (pseudouridine1915-N3)-methyltransferase
MKVTLLCIGKTSSREIDSLVADYEKRLQHYVNFEVNIIYLPAKMKRKSEAEQKQAEGELILSKINPTSPLILLDERGKSMRSTAFARFLQTEMNRGPKELVFCIGGAFGFSDAVYQQANMQISLSEMTFTHQMVRLFFTEQLYRAFTILKGEKYHH